MSSFVRLLVVSLLLIASVPPANAGLFDRKPGRRKKPIQVKRKVPSRSTVPITAFDVLGNRNVSKEVVILALATKVGDRFTEDRLKKDVETVKGLGYFSQIETDLTPYQGGVKITFRVAENPTINTVSIQGNKLLPTKRIMHLLNIRTGATLNLTQLQDGIKSINREYMDLGYAFCGILSNEQFSIDPRSGTLKIRILEAKLRKLIVTGNKKTRPGVITREMASLRKGKLLKTEDIKRSMRDVHNLGYFEDVKPPHPKLDLKSQAIDLNFEVKEQKTGTASFGGGYSSVNGFVGFVDVAESNFRGGGQTARAKYQFGGEQSYLFSFVEPWFRNRPVSAGASLYRTRVQREQFVNGTNLNRFLEDRSGFGLSTGWRVARDTRVSGSLSTERVTIDRNIANRGSILAALPADMTRFDDNGDGIVTFGEQSIGLNWTKDKRDNFQVPREGWRLSLGGSMTGGILQGINGFNKYIADYRTYAPVNICGGTTFAMRARAGLSQVTRGELRFIDRFAVGGNDSIRGFQDREFTGGHFLVSNLELRKDFSKIVGAALFFDAGDAWGVEGRDFGLKSSYGAGLRVITPLGPFRLDYGLPTDGRDGRLHFGIGQSF